MEFEIILSCTQCSKETKEPYMCKKCQKPLCEECKKVNKKS